MSGSPTPRLGGSAAGAAASGPSIDLLSDLRGGGVARGVAAGGVPAPRRRWSTRVVLPTVLLCGAAGLLAYGARGALFPGPLVRVAPVVVQPVVGPAPFEQAPFEQAPERTAAADGSVALAPSGSDPPPQRVVVQAPGWIEPAPFATTVTALVEGVLTELLVLEGESVEAGQVVARLDAGRATLALRRAQAELVRLEADVVRAQAEARVAEARSEELREDLRRQRPLVDAGGSTAAEVAKLERRLAAAEEEIAASRSLIDVARADVDRARVDVDQAGLDLQRTEVRAPIAGTVMRLLAEPGTVLSMSGRGGDAMPGAILRLYDPTALQVRVDVPIADAAGVVVGAPVELRCEALPDATLKGTVRRLVHEANIQRNTVQVKVGLEDPSPVLKPEMLVRARILAPAARQPEGDAQPSRATTAEAGRVRLLVPIDALLDRGDGAATAWTVDPGSLPGEWIATERSVACAPSSAEGFMEATRGLKPGDRVILRPPQGLASGTRVRIASAENEVDEAPSPPAARAPDP